MKRPESSAQDIAGKDRQLATLLRAAQAFDALDRRVQAVLSDSSRGRIQVACVNDGVLVLAADSPAWATRARLESEGCLAAAREVWPQAIHSVKVIVRQQPAI